jgi:hypothetical protein
MVTIKTGHRPPYLQQVSKKRQHHVHENHQAVSQTRLEMYSAVSSHDIESLEYYMKWSTLWSVNIGKSLLYYFFCQFGRTEQQFQSIQLSEVPR